jgi:hypothetical protein
VTLSGGQRARVALARALYAADANGAAALFLDDVLAACDAHTAAAIWCEGGGRNMGEGRGRKYGDALVQGQRMRALPWRAGSHEHASLY